MVAQRSQRQLRVSENLRQSLAQVFLRSEIQDERLFDVSVTVTEVQVSPDMRQATAYIMPLASKDPDAIVKALNEKSIRKFVRGRLARNSTMKYTPSVFFKLDETFETSSQIDAVLRSKDVARDLVDKDDDQESDA